jgi:hypothetical protein
MTVVTTFDQYGTNFLLEKLNAFPDIIRGGRNFDAAEK